MLEVSFVELGSIAHELGLEAGDRLLYVNGQQINDLVDFMIEERKETLIMVVEKSNGDLWELDIEHDGYQPLGIGLPHPTPQQCGNNCIFCFVHQLPRGMRRSLYVKDEDYRFSYLYGAYVTLTNLTERDLKRILDKRLSPLYISVHAVDRELRERLFGKPVPDIMPILKRLTNGGIELHTQVVVCPGINDGYHLERTLEFLTSLIPGLSSLALVPVGLTRHRLNLPVLHTHTRQEANELITWLETKQAEYLKDFGTRFVYAADEFYLKAEQDFPASEAYEGFPQIENGVGIIPVFRRQLEEIMKEVRPLEIPPISLVTGVSAAAEIKILASKLNKKCGLDLRVHTIENHLFGSQITVAGLLGGNDIIKQLAGADLGEVLLIPDVMLREGEELFLDDVRVQELAAQLQVEVEIVPANPWGIWDMLDTLNEEFS